MKIVRFLKIVWDDTVYHIPFDKGFWKTCLSEILLIALLWGLGIPFANHIFKEEYYPIEWYSWMNVVAGFGVAFAIIMFFVVLWCSIWITIKAFHILMIFIDYLKHSWNKAE